MLIRQPASTQSFLYRWIKIAAILRVVLKDNTILKMLSYYWGHAYTRTMCSYHFIGVLEHFTVHCVWFFIELYFCMPALHLLLRCSFILVLIVCMLRLKIVDWHIFIDLFTHNFTGTIKYMFNFLRSSMIRLENTIRPKSSYKFNSFPIQFSRLKG